MGHFRPLYATFHSYDNDQRLWFPQDHWWKCQWIGLRENLNRKPELFSHSIWGFPIFPVNFPIHRIPIFNGGFSTSGGWWENSMKMVAFPPVIPPTGPHLHGHVLHHVPCHVPGHGHRLRRIRRGRRGRHGHHGRHGHGPVHEGWKISMENDGKIWNIIYIYIYIPYIYISYIYIIYIYISYIYIYILYIYYEISNALENFVWKNDTKRDLKRNPKRLYLVRVAQLNRRLKVNCSSEASVQFSSWPPCSWPPCPCIQKMSQGSPESNGLSVYHHVPACGGIPIFQHTQISLNIFG